MSQSAASGQAHVSHKTRKIGNVRKKNRQSISELLERKIGADWAHVYFGGVKWVYKLLQRKQVQLSSDISMEGGEGRV